MSEKFQNGTNYGGVEKDIVSSKFTERFLPLGSSDTTPEDCSGRISDVLEKFPPMDKDPIPIMTTMTTIMTTMTLEFNMIKV